jgi:hypothetical protein
MLRNRQSSVLSRIPLANSRGSDALIPSRAREEAVAKSIAGRHTSVAVTRREFVALSAVGGSLFFTRNSPPHMRRIVISVNLMFDRGAHSGRGLGQGEVSLFNGYQAKAAREYATSGIFFDIRVSEGAYMRQQGFTEIPDQFLAPGMINLFVTETLGYDVDRDRTGGVSMGPQARTRAFARSPGYKIFFGLKDARDTTLPHEYAHHFTLDTQRDASMKSNLWADLRNDYWLWRQRHGVPISEFHACAHSEWARFEGNP